MLKSLALPIIFLITGYCFSDGYFLSAVSDPFCLISNFQLEKCSNYFFRIAITGRVQTDRLDINLVDCHDKLSNFGLLVNLSRRTNFLYRFVA